MVDSRAVRTAALVCLATLAVPGMPTAQKTPDAEAAPACIDPAPTDDALVRRAAEWMLPDRTIEIPEFETGSTDIVRGMRAHVSQARAGLSLMPISRSVAHPLTEDFSISATMNLTATLRVEYTMGGGGGACDLTVQGPFAVRADVMVDRSQPFEDRVQPLTINQVNDSGLRLQGCGEVTGIAGFDDDVRDHLAALAVTEIFVPACRPCESPVLQACATP